MTARDAWREVADLDDRLDRGEIDDQTWFDAICELVTPAYLAAQTPWSGSGKSGTAKDWGSSRSHIAHSIDRPGSFLDVGCANGYMLECLGRSERANLRKPQIDYRVLWVDNERRTSPISEEGS